MIGLQVCKRLKKQGSDHKNCLLSYSESKGTCLLKINWKPTFKVNLRFFK